MYQYGWLDEVTQITEGGKVIRSFHNHMAGRLAGAYDGFNAETFLRDELALNRCDRPTRLNFPAVIGGNPVFGTESGVMFNDMLGTTLGIKGNDFTRTNLTAFGENLDAGDKAFFTGKPLVGELGYAFLFRNYRPEQGKWQTADPMGYPDGWNNFAYCNNGVTMVIDWLGAVKRIIINASGAGTSSSIGGGISGGSGSSSGGWGHSWFDLDDGNGNISGHGFYPEDPAG